MSDPIRQGLLSLPGWEDMDQHGLVDWMTEHDILDVVVRRAGGGLNPSLMSAARRARELGVTEVGPLTELLTYLSTTSGRDPETAAKEADRTARRTGGEIPPSTRIPRTPEPTAIANAAHMINGAKGWSSPEPIPESPREQLDLMLTTFYQPDDLLSVQPAKSKKHPGPMPRGLLLSVADLLMDGPPAPGPGGVWWRANPVYTTSGKNGSATDLDTVGHEWLMVESDCLPLEQQVPLYLAAGLRPSAILDSGSQSLQAHIRLSVSSFEEYDQVALEVLRALEVCGVDPANANVSRLRRMPGCIRPDGRDGPGTVQKMVYWDPEAPALTLEGAKEVAARVRRKLASRDLIWVEDIRLDMTAAPIDFVEGLLTRNAMSVTYGESNVGKSFFLLDISAHAATGKVWRAESGHPLITDPTPVLYIALEGVLGLTQRIHVLKEHGILDPKAPFAIMTTPIDLQDEASALDVLQKVEAFKAKVGLPPGLIVLDTLSRAFGPGSENDAKDMTKAVRNLDVVKLKTPAHVAPIHHSGKDQARGARGHSSLRAATDTEIELFRPEGSKIITAVVKKQRDIEPCAPMPFELVSVPLYTNSRGKAVTSCVVRHLPPEEAGTRDAVQERKKEGRKVGDLQEYERVLTYLPQRSQRAWAEAADMKDSTLRDLLARVIERHGCRHTFDPKTKMIDATVNTMPDLDGAV